MSHSIYDSNDALGYLRENQEKKSRDEIITFCNMFNNCYNDVVKLMYFRCLN